MKIAQFAPIWIPVPPRSYGGIEFMVSELTEGLLKRGHEVTLFATQDSQTDGRLISPWPTSLWRAKLNSPHAVWSLHLSNLLDHHEEFDIIHDHATFYTAPFTPFFRPPVVSTLHRPLTPETQKVFEKYPNINYVPVSEDQRTSAAALHHVNTIHNGVPIERFTFNNEPDDYLLWISKIIPGKGILEAIEVAKSSGSKLKIAGNIVGEENERFFKYEVLPHIDGTQIEFVGEVDFDTKHKLFRNARAFLAPFKRREPFGLVLTEAMVCGTPVIGFKDGAIPEIIEDGVTGFVVNDTSEMCEAVRKIGSLDRANCRARVVDHFSTERMIDDYENLYARIVNTNE